MNSPAASAISYGKKKEKPADKIRPSTFEPACNPIAQAKLLNRVETDMNIIFGLCVGHDILFTKFLFSFSSFIKRC